MLKPLCLGRCGIGVFLVILWLTAEMAKADEYRFFFEGDGHIHLISEKSKAYFSGRYRTPSGHYDETAYQRICNVFNASCDSPSASISLRLVAFLDFLEDRLKAKGPITITSGFRSPVYNTRLRQRGRLAAKASLHQYGMAADFFMDGVSSKHVWQYVKALSFGGTGYYHGKTVHVDVGPARSWDEKTSGVGTGLADDNKLIGLVTDYDLYPSGALMTLRFIRMTVFPIGIQPNFQIERLNASGQAEKVTPFTPEFTVSTSGPCPQLADIAQLAGIQWRIPAQLPAGRYKITARFCDKQWEKMPAQVFTPTFEIISPK